MKKKHLSASSFLSFFLGGGRKRRKKSAAKKHLIGFWQLRSARCTKKTLALKRLAGGRYIVEGILGWVYQTFYTDDRTCTTLQHAQSTHAVIKSKCVRDKQVTQPKLCDPQEGKGAKVLNQTNLFQPYLFPPLKRLQPA